MAARDVTATDGTADVAGVAGAPAPWQRVYVIALSAVIGGTIAYAACDWSGWTRLQLDPYRGAWWWQDGPTQKLAINYYGTILWGLGGAAVGGALAALITLRRRALPAPLVSLLAAWALSGFLLAGVYYTWSLWPF